MSFEHTHYGTKLWWNDREGWGVGGSSAIQGLLTILILYDTSVTRLSELMKRAVFISHSVPFDVYSFFNAGTYMMRFLVIPIELFYLE